jgi:CRP-like cAMP-binding protein
MAAYTPIPTNRDKAVALTRPAFQAAGRERNLILAGLSPQASSLLHKHMREQELAEGAVLWGAGGHPSDIFFPLSGMISIRVPSKEGHAIEVATIGREGAAGVHDGSMMLAAVTQAVVQVAGRLAGVSAQAFAAAARESDEIRCVARACRGWPLLQSQLLAACNAVHSADARFCRWLLRASDALATDVVPATQETIAQTLGVRRTTATLIAQHLQLRGAISYSRGRIAIRDRAALQSSACDCYSFLVRRHWPCELLARGTGWQPVRPDMATLNV